MAEGVWSGPFEAPGRRQDGDRSTKREDGEAEARRVGPLSHAFPSQ